MSTENKAVYFPVCTLGNGCQNIKFGNSSDFTETAVDLYPDGRAVVFYKSTCIGDFMPNELAGMQYRYTDGSAAIEMLIGIARLIAQKEKKDAE